MNEVKGLEVARAAAWDRFNVAEQEYRRAKWELDEINRDWARAAVAEGGVG